MVIMDGWTETAAGRDITEGKLDVPDIWKVAPRSAPVWRDCLDGRALGEEASQHISLHT